MATVRLCLFCGYVNDWRRSSCFSCGHGLDVPGFKRADLKPGMRIHIPLLDPMVTARRLGRGRVFITPERKVGVVRRRLVTGLGFLRRSSAETQEPIILSDHPPFARALSHLCPQRSVEHGAQAG